MDKNAQIAVRGAKLYKTIGRWAALRYIDNNQCPRRLYYLARLLEAAKCTTH